MTGSAEPITRSATDQLGRAPPGMSGSRDVRLSHGLLAGCTMPEPPVCGVWT